MDQFRNKTEYAALLKDRGMLIHDLVDVVVLLDKYVHEIT